MYIQEGEKERVGVVVVPSVPRPPRRLPILASRKLVRAFRDFEGET
jgi:hypothetical protein